MTSLNFYMQDMQRMLAEQRQQQINPLDMRAYINRGRRDLAMRSQCIRRLTPISGSITVITVNAGGSGYSQNPTITITAPDFPSGGPDSPNGRQATAVADVQGGVIVAITVTDGGAGYFRPTITITDTTGTGASASTTIGGINVLRQGQEVYNFSDIDVSSFPGVQSVYFVRGVSLIYSNYRYSLPNYAFTVYQANIRNYPAGQYQWVPSFYSQFGQGVNGSLYFFPLPAQTTQAEFDCNCIPSDLDNNQSVEAIPAPWTDAVVFLACRYAMVGLQNYNAANFFDAEYEKFAKAYSQYPRAGRVTNPYGRY